jgi:hypothetical protein
LHLYSDKFRLYAGYPSLDGGDVHIWVFLKSIDVTRNFEVEFILLDSIENLVMAILINNSTSPTGCNNFFNALFLL